MIDVIERCFKEKIEKPEWNDKMKLMIPSYGKSLIDDVELLHSIRQRTLTTLGLRSQE
jgi:malate dehydrogenase (quinone)